MGFDVVELVVFACVAGLLASASVFDLRERIIPNKIVILIVVAWLACEACAAAFLDIDQVVMQALADIVSACLVLVVLIAFTSIIERTRSKSMFGGGDIKTLAALSLFLGIEGIVACLLIACVLGLAYALLRIPDVAKRGIPFAPCIALSYLVLSTLA